MDAPFSFNRSVRIGSRRDRITGDSGALTGRELLRRSGVVRFLAKGLRTSGTGAGSGIRRGGWRGRFCCWRGRAAGTTATPRRCGTIRRCGWPPATGRARLLWARADACPRSRHCRGGWRRGRRRRVPEVLREGLQRLAGWRLKAMGGWRRPETLVIDIDSLPVEVHGEQSGSAWNGYYHRRVYHPIVAAAGETGDILDLRLREGQVHTADGGLEFVLEVLERAERHLCGKAAVRFDAGYPGEPLMAALEERGTHYVARVRNNAVLKRLALPAIDAVVWDALQGGTTPGRRAPHLGPRVVLPGRVVVPSPPGGADRRRAARRAHPPMFLAPDFPPARGDVRRGAPGAVPRARQGGGPPGRADERHLPGPFVRPPPPRATTGAA